MKFSDLKPSDVFSYRSDFYTKMEDCHVGISKRNAFEHETGKPVYFSPDTIVCRAEAAFKKKTKKFSEIPFGTKFRWINDGLCQKPRFKYMMNGSGDSVVMEEGCTIVVEAEAFMDYEVEVL